MVYMQTNYMFVKTSYKFQSVCVVTMKLCYFRSGSDKGKEFLRLTLQRICDFRGGSNEQKELLRLTLGRSIPCFYQIEIFRCLHR
jgi:hypothetical protein